MEIGFAICFVLFPISDPLSRKKWLDNIEFLSFVPHVLFTNVGTINIGFPFPLERGRFIQWNDTVQSGIVLYAQLVFLSERLITQGIETNLQLFPYTHISEIESITTYETQFTEIENLLQQLSNYFFNFGID